MKVGDFTDLINILSLDKTDNTYSWVETFDIFSKVKRSNSKNLFSTFGVGAKAIEFTVRKLEYENLSQHNAIKWNNSHCFISDIIESEDKEYYIVNAALIEPKICNIEHTSEPTYNDLNNPIYSEPNIIIFPACVTEKYVRYTQGQPMSTIETLYILITPKSIVLNKGEIVSFNNKKYEIILDHKLDDFKNEYEILLKDDT